MVRTLQDVIEPLQEAEFLNLLRERRLTHLRGNRPTRFRDLIDWNTLLEVLKSGAHPAKSLTVTRANGNVVPPLFYLDGGKPSADKLSRLVEQGASVVVKGLDPSVSQLTILKESIRERTGEQIAIAVIVTTGTGGAFKTHYDVEDVLVMQIEGSKHWKVLESPVVHPVKGLPRGDAPQASLAFDEVVEAGDTLLVPGGYWHYCENGPGRSIHAAILFHPLSGKQAVDHLLRRLVEYEDFRRPLLRHPDVDLKDAEAALKTRLIEEIGRMSLAELRDIHQSGKPSERY